VKTIKHIDNAGGGKTDGEKELCHMKMHNFMRQKNVGVAC